MTQRNTTVTTTITATTKISANGDLICNVVCMCLPGNLQKFHLFAMEQLLLV